MVDWACVNGYGDEGGDPDHDIHDPAGHCGEPLLTGHVWPEHLRGSRLSVYGPVVRCKFCGTTNVYWQMTRSGYRLHNTDDLEKHNCRVAQNINAEGFDDVV